MQIRFFVMRKNIMRIKLKAHESYRSGQRCGMWWAKKNCNESSGGLERKKIKEETNYEKTSLHSDGSRIKRFLEYACILRCMRIFKIVCHTCELLTARFISSRSKKSERSNKKIRKEYTPKTVSYIPLEFLLIQ